MLIFPRGKTTHWIWLTQQSKSIQSYTNATSASLITSLLCWNLHTHLKVTKPCFKTSMCLVREQQACTWRLLWEYSLGHVQAGSHRQQTYRSTRRQSQATSPNDAVTHTRSITTCAHQKPWLIGEVHSLLTAGNITFKDCDVAGLRAVAPTENVHRVAPN